MSKTSRRLGAKGFYLTLVGVADRILWLRGDEVYKNDWTNQGVIKGLEVLDGRLSFSLLFFPFLN